MNDLAFLRVTDGGEGGYVVVDAHRFEELNSYSWHKGESGRVVCSTYGKRCSLASMVNRTPGDLDTDHVNQDLRDYRECNLRTATRSQNMANDGKRSKTYGRCSSDYKGVSWCNHESKWCMSIVRNYKQVRWGSFTREVEAAYAYDVAASLLFGDFAFVNGVSNELGEGTKVLIEERVFTKLLKYFDERSLFKKSSPHESGGHVSQP